jgi:2-dehydropantoate 2-reductase
MTSIPDMRVAVVGVGATGAVLAAALLSQYPETFLVDTRPDLGETLKKNGIEVSGAISMRAPVKNFAARLNELADFEPNILFLSTKTCHLETVLKDLKGLFRPGLKIISTHNGLGTEDVIAAEFGREAALRMSLNFGAAMKAFGQVHSAFFNRPNHLGSLTPQNQPLGLQIAAMLTGCGLETAYVDDIKLHVWRKMIMKCTMASICAVTDKTIKEALDFPPTREIANACFREALAVAKAVGYDLGEAYLEQAVGYLEKVGVHRDSMCDDIANKRPTEIDFLGGKIVQYAREKNVPVPFYLAMTNLVKAIEDNYLKQ